MVTTEPIRGPAARPMPLSASASRARRRALVAIGAVGALLVVLWLSDSLAGLLPTTPYAPTTQTVGGYRITLALTPTQPRAGTTIAARIALTDANRQALPNATVTYTWEMVSMDMGVATGHADAITTIPGSYTTQVQGTMGGAWRLTLHIHRANQPEAATSFIIHLHG